MSRSPRKMRVLKIREFAYPTYVGGIEVCLKELCPALARMGVKLLLLTCSGRGLPHHSLEGGFEVLRVGPRLISALTTRLKVTGIFYGMVVRALFLLFLPLYLFKLVRRENFDIIHVHCLSALSAAPASLVGLILKKPLLITLHGTFLEAYRDVLPFPINCLIFSLEKIFLQYGYYNRILVEDRYTIRILSKLSVPREKISLLNYPGIDVEKFAKAVKKEDLAGGPIILHHGRLVKKRGLNHLIEAFPHILKEFPNAKLLIVGEGPEREKLMRLAERLDISGNVIFTGLIPHEEMPALIKSIDVFVIPSVIEGHSTSLLEAMAAGRPVVATRVGGIVEVVTNGVNGLLVNPKNPEQISRAVVRLLKDRSLSEKLSKNAFITVKSFDVKNLAEQELKVYNSLIGVGVEC